MSRRASRGVPAASARRGSSTSAGLVTPSRPSPGRRATSSGVAAASVSASPAVTNRGRRHSAVGARGSVGPGRRMSTNANGTLKRVSASGRTPGRGAGGGAGAAGAGTMTGTAAAAAAGTAGAKGTPARKGQARQGHRGSVGSNPFSSDRARELAKRRKGPRSARNVSVKTGRGIFARWFGDKETIELNANATQAVDILGLTIKDITRLKFQFDEIDVDGSGVIDNHEFFDFIDEPRSPMTDAVFELCAQGGGTISFSAYVSVCVTYCMYNREEILKFVFNTFDADSSGAIDEDEFINLCKVVNAGSPAFAGNFQTAVENFDSNDDGLIDFDEFRELNKRYPLILFPAFRLQDRMQRSTLGERKWTKVLEVSATEHHMESYARKHNGNLPPGSIGSRCGNYLFGNCCACCKSKRAKYKEKQRFLRKKHGDKLKQDKLDKKKEKKKAAKGKKGAAKGSGATVVLHALARPEDT